MKINLTKIQQQIVFYDEGPLLVVAGPGSGKTRVITERIKHLLTEKVGNFHVLALTFTNKAANEMKERLEGISEVEDRAFIGTLHSFCTKVLSDRGDSIGIRDPPIILESLDDRKILLLNALTTDPFLKDLVPLKNYNKNEVDKFLSSSLDLISKQKNKMLFPEMVDDNNKRRIYEKYQSELRASNFLDFDDILLKTYELFLKYPKITSFYRRQYRYICIDEAQDLNKLQYEILKTLCGEDQKNIIMVGDQHQAIFEFNGANPGLMNEFQNDFNAKKIVMMENFRSSRAIVEAAQRLVPEFSVIGQLPIEGLVKLIVGVDEDEETEKVFNFLSEKIALGDNFVEGDLTWDRCAIIGRNRYILNSIENKLKNESIPYYKQASSQLHSESNLMQDLELCMGLIANSQDLLHLGLLLNKWNQSVDPKEFLANALSNSSLISEIITLAMNTDHKIIADAVKILTQDQREFSMNEVLKYIRTECDKEDEPDERELTVKDVEQLERHWSQYLRSQSSEKRSISSFLNNVSLGETLAPRGDGIALLTLHSAKGLEFDVVVLMGMIEGTFPDYRSKDNALQEEIRNAFVAVTRAKRLLVISYPKQKKMPWGDVMSTIPSRFIKNISQN